MKLQTIILISLLCAQHHASAPFLSGFFGQQSCNQMAKRNKKIDQRTAKISHFVWSNLAATGRLVKSYMRNVTPYNISHEPSLKNTAALAACLAGTAAAIITTQKLYSWATTAQNNPNPKPQPEQKKATSTAPSTNTGSESKPVETVSATPQTQSMNMPPAQPTVSAQDIDRARKLVRKLSADQARHIFRNVGDLKYLNRMRAAHPKITAPASYENVTRHEHQSMMQDLLKGARR